MTQTIKHFCADNDSNGNPRRLYVLSLDGEQVAAWDEGYHGHDVVPGVFREAAYRAERVEIKPRQYNQLRRELPSPDWAHEVQGLEHLREEVLLDPCVEDLAN